MKEKIKGGGTTPKECINVSMVGMRNEIPTENIWDIEGGWSTFFLFDPPILMGGDLNFPKIYFTIINRTSTGDGVYVGGKYPYGRIRFYFSDDDLEWTTAGKNWFDPGGLGFNVVQDGLISCNASQNVYDWPNPCCGTYAFGSHNGAPVRLITGMWVHLRDNASTFFLQAGAAQCTNVRICNAPGHPEWVDGVEDSKNYI